VQGGPRVCLGMQACVCVCMWLYPYVVCLNDRDCDCDCDCVRGRVHTSTCVLRTSAEETTSSARSECMCRGVCMLVHVCVQGRKMCEAREREMFVYDVTICCAGRSCCCSDGQLRR
jgi:hypothetical protein